MYSEPRHQSGIGSGLLTNQRSRREILKHSTGDQSEKIRRDLQTGNEVSPCHHLITTEGARCMGGEGPAQRD